MIVGAGPIEPLRVGVARLTAREQEVLSLMAEGCSNPEICARLFLSAKTVETHVGRILDKLDLGISPGINRRVLAVLMYLEHEPARRDLVVS